MLGRSGVSKRSYRKSRGKFSNERKEKLINALRRLESDVTAAAASFSSFDGSSKSFYRWTELYIGMFEHGMPQLCTPDSGTALYHLACKVNCIAKYISADMSNYQIKINEQRTTVDPMACSQYSKKAEAFLSQSLKRANSQAETAHLHLMLRVTKAFFRDLPKLSLMINFVVDEHNLLDESDECFHGGLDLSMPRSNASAQSTEKVNNSIMESLAVVNIGRDEWLDHTPKWYRLHVDSNSDVNSNSECTKYC